MLYDALPVTTTKHWLMFLGYVAFQAILMIVLPGKHAKGIPTPTGNTLPYKINGNQNNKSILIFYNLLGFSHTSQHSAACYLGYDGSLLRGFPLLQTVPHDYRL